MSTVGSNGDLLIIIIADSPVLVGELGKEVQMIRSEEDDPRRPPPPRPPLHQERWQKKERRGLVVVLRGIIVIITAARRRRRRRMAPSTTTATLLEFQHLRRHRQTPAKNRGRSSSRKKEAEEQAHTIQAPMTDDPMMMDWFFVRPG